MRMLSARSRLNRVTIGEMTVNASYINRPRGQTVERGVCSRSSVWSGACLGMPRDAASARSRREWPRCVIPGAFGGPWVLPRLEDRGQPPFLHQFEAGNVGGSREGSRFPPLEPHAGLQGLHSHSAAITHRLRPADALGRRRRASGAAGVALLPTWRRTTVHARTQMLILLFA